MKKLVLLLTILTLPLFATWQNPTPIYVGPGDQEIDVVISDGAGGAAVIWRDAETDWNYMQVIDSEGELKWDAEGVPIIASAGLVTQNPDVFQDAEGNYWIALEGNEDIYVQKLSPTGQRLFGDDGVAVCTAEGEQSNSHICYSENIAIAAWTDLRTSPSHSYTQSLDNNGQIRWAVDGVLVATPDYSSQAKPATDNHGGAFFIFRRWIDSQNHIAFQHMDSLGNRLWGDSGTIYSETYSFGDFMAQDNLGGFVFSYYGFGGITKVQRVDSSGSPVWDTGGVIIMQNEQGGGEYYLTDRHWVTFLLGYS